MGKVVGTRTSLCRASVLETYMDPTLEEADSGVIEVIFNRHWSIPVLIPPGKTPG